MMADANAMGTVLHYPQKRRRRRARKVAPDARGSFVPAQTNDDETGAMAAPPTSHNAPEFAALSFEENENAKLDAARDAFTRLKRAFEDWVVIGKGLKVLQLKAVELNLGRKTFKRLREQIGFGGISDATVTRALAILDNLPAVTKWRQSLSERERYQWASPDAVHRHCPKFQKDKKPKPSAWAQLKAANVALQEENHRLKAGKVGQTAAENTATLLDFAREVAGQTTRSRDSSREPIYSFCLRGQQAHEFGLLLEQIHKILSAEGAEHDKNDRGDVDFQTESQERWIESS
jgi:hypothetical protein